MTTPPVLRAMPPADASAVARIGFSAWESNLIEDSWRTDVVRRRVEADFARFAADPGCEITLALQDDEIVGWGAIDSRSRPGDPDAARNYISDLWVEQRWQGQGIGTILLLFLIDRIRKDGHRAAQIETGIRNLTAIRLYQRHGFQEIWRGEEYSESLGMLDHRVLFEKPL